MSQQTPSSSLLHHEQWEYGTRFIPKEKENPSSPQEIAQELLARPGRFRSPLSFGEKIRLKFFIASGALDFFGLGKYFSYTFSQKRGIPFAWQVLFKYLKREGVLEKEEGAWGYFFHDEVKGTHYFLTRGHIKGVGRSTDRDVSLSKAVGEMVERRFLSWREGNKKARASVSDLQRSGRKFLHPEALSQFSRGQKERLSRITFSPQDIFSWVEGKEYLSGKRTLLPLQSFLWTGLTEKIEPLLREQNSNGAAGHFTLEEALLSGMYEAVERDSFLIFWLNNLAPPVMDTSHIEGPELHVLLDQVRRYQFEAVFLNTTSDIAIPSCLCVLIDRSQSGPRVATGGGSGFDVATMMYASLSEALAVIHNFSYVSSLPSLPDQYVPFSDATMNQEKRILLWQNPEMFQKIQFFLSGPKQTLAEAFPHLPIFRDKKEELAHVTNIFRSLGKGYEVYYYEVRDKILETIGYHVVRVIIPELVHMYLHEINAPLGASRLRTVPKKLGLVAATEWNPLPHPFP